MNLTKGLLLAFICVSLMLSVVFSIKSFTGYIVSDISDGIGNMKSFVLLLLGIVGTFAYVKTFKNR